MYGKTKFIVFDGMDDCGKSTLIKDLARDLWPMAKEIQFPKTLPSGALLRFGGEKDFEMLFTMFELLDQRRTYLMDRFIVSNLVYDKILRGEDTDISNYYHREFKRRFDVLEVFVTRPQIRNDFVDDRIKLTQAQFNAGIEEYKKYGPNYQILNRDLFDKATEPNGLRDNLFHMCADFIRGQKSGPSARNG